jgi:hypothetical protein
VVRSEWRADKFTARGCASDDVSRERGAGEVGGKEPHERGDSVIMGDNEQARGTKRHIRREARALDNRD